MNARELSQQLEREQFKALKANPQEGVQRIAEEAAEQGLFRKPDADFDRNWGLPEIARDPLEDDPIANAKICAARTNAYAELGLSEGQEEMGDCHRIWSVQKRILKEKYGLEWRTPAEMNPDIIFD